MKSNRKYSSSNSTCVNAAFLIGAFCSSAAETIRFELSGLSS
jgi:hypothetical protein